SREISSLRHMRAAISSEQVLERVAKRYKVSVSRLVQGEYGLEARNVAMWLLWEGGDKSLREIGEMFGGLDYAAVAQRIRRARLGQDKKSAHKLLDQILNI